jgi:formylglycine-generating enzyme required for sulfatase activity
MTQVFISYSRRDIAFVERLAKDITSAGFDVWYDMSNLKVGTNWGKEIQVALSKSQVLIVVLSPHSLESRWVEREYIYAENHHLNIIPILYKPCELPLWTLDLQHVDLTTGQYKKHLEELISVLGTPDSGHAKELPEHKIQRVQSPRSQTMPELEEPEHLPMRAEPIAESIRSLRAGGEQSTKVSTVSSKSADLNLKTKREVKSRLWLLSSTFVLLVLAAGAYTGQRLGWFSLSPNPTQTVLSTAKATSLPTARAQTQAPTSKPVIDFSPSNAEEAKSFADPIQGWVSTVGSDFEDDFSTPREYWDRFLTLDGQIINFEQMVVDQSFQLHTNTESALLVRMGEAYYTEKEHKVMRNSYVFQFDVWSDPQEVVQVQLGITGENRHLLSVFNNAGGLKVDLVESGSGALITDLGYNGKVILSPGEWHTNQFIAYDNDLAIYVDDYPAYYKKDVDLRDTIGIEMLLILDADGTLNLDNFLLWNLNYEQGISNPVPGTFWTPTRISTRDGMELVYIPAGSFRMGSDVLVNGNEDSHYFPAHNVTLSAFWIDSHEVTNGQYHLCVVDGICSPPKLTSSLTRESYYGNTEFDDYPVVNVDWSMAKTYCEWAGRRLPTEAEWEMASHGVETFLYPWGNTYSQDYGNFKETNEDTTPVKKYENGRSYYGVYDMSGNVWEWVNDYFSDNYYSQSPIIDPQGPLQGNAREDRIMRGGCFMDSGDWANVITRMNNNPIWFEWSTGFRCAVSNIQD